MSRSIRIRKLSDEKIKKKKKSNTFPDNPSKMVKDEPVRECDGLQKVVHGSSVSAQRSHLAEQDGAAVAGSEETKSCSEA